jgi:hypothetical protein
VARPAGSGTAEAKRSRPSALANTTRRFDAQAGTLDEVPRAQEAGQLVGEQGRGDPRIAQEGTGVGGGRGVDDGGAGAAGVGGRCVPDEGGIVAREDGGRDLLIRLEQPPPAEQQELDGDAVRLQELAPEMQQQVLAAGREGVVPDEEQGALARLLVQPRGRAPSRSGRRRRSAGRVPGRRPRPTRSRR